MNDHLSQRNTADPRDADVARGHELDTVSRRTILVSVSGLIVVMAAALLLVHELSNLFRDEDNVVSASTPQTEPGPPDVEEQFTPDQPAQLQALHQSETERLTTYRWTDQSAGVAQIPVARAIDLLAERGLPSTPPPSEPSTSNHKSPDAQNDQTDSSDTKPKAD